MSDARDTHSDVDIHETSRNTSAQTIADMKAHIAMLTEGQQNNVKRQEILSKVVLGDGKPQEGILWILEENRAALVNVAAQLKEIKDDQKILFTYDTRLKIVETHVTSAQETQKTISETFKKWRGKFWCC